MFSATWLKFALHQPFLLLALTLGLLVVAGLTYTKMGGNFLPPFREPTVLVATTLAPGTSLKTTVEVSQIAQDRLLGIKGIEKVSYRAGRAERGDHVVPVSTVEIEVEFDEYGEEHREPRRWRKFAPRCAASPEPSAP